MKKQKQLLFARNMFAIILFTLLGIIVVVEKGNENKIAKTQKEIDKYFEENYKEIKDNTTQEKIALKDGIYSMKIVSKKNKNLYFYIKKEKKKITDTYKEDYLEGRTLLNALSKKIEKEIKEKTHTKPTIKMTSTLDEFITSTQEKIIQEENLLELKFYTLEKELLINNWSTEEIVKQIIDTMNIYESQNITPKNYIFIITNENNITESVEIKNITSNFTNNSENNKIIDDIINDKNSQLLKENKITYKYLNEEE